MSTNRVRTWSAILVVVLGAATPAHGQKSAADLVTLYLGSGTPGVCSHEFYTVPPDGTQGPQFRVPAGKAFVITDVSWRIDHPAGSAVAGQIRSLRLFAINLADEEDRNVLVDSTVTLSSAGQGGTIHSLTTGAVVNAAARICPEVVTGTVSAMVHGYLISDK